MPFFSFKTIFTRFKIPKLARRLLNRNRILLAYSSATFYWDNYKITDDELKVRVSEMLDEFRTQNHLLNMDDNSINTMKSSNEKRSSDDINETNKWEKVFHKKNLIIWRRKLIELNRNGTKEVLPSYLYEYRLFGRLYDVTPLDFYKVQIDLDYRSLWDNLVVSLRMIDCDHETRSELVHWIMKFPYPMYSREYVFIRRYCMEPVERLLIVYSHSIQDPNFKIPQEVFKLKESRSGEMRSGFGQPQPKAPFVRVTNYESQMIIIPHEDFNQNGLDYILQYYDDPKARIPNMAYKWMAASGLPDWLDKLHDAARQIPTTNEDELNNIQIFLLNEQSTVVSEDSKEDVTKDEPQKEAPNIEEKLLILNNSNEYKEESLFVENTMPFLKFMSNLVIRLKDNLEVILLNFEDDPLQLFFLF